MDSWKEKLFQFAPVRLIKEIYAHRSSEYETTLVPRTRGLPTDIKMEENKKQHPQKHPSTSVGVVVSKDTVLHKAARAGDMETVRRSKEMIKCGNAYGNLPLHLAVRNKHEEVAKFLVGEYPQASYALNGDNLSPLHLAVQSKQVYMVEYMLQRIRNVRPEALTLPNSIVNAAIDTKNQGMLGAILKHRADLLDVNDAQGQTPLLYAAKKRNVEMVKFIIQNYPNTIFRVDSSGKTILHIIASQRDKGLNSLVTDLLNLPNGERLLAMEDENDFTALMLAQNGRRNPYVETVIKERMQQRRRP